MHASRFIQTFCLLTNPDGISTATMRAHHLRQEDLLPRGGTGSSAPHLEPLHMARLLLALVVPGPVSDVLAQTLKYSSLYADPEGDGRAFAAFALHTDPEGDGAFGVDLETAVAALFSEEALANAVDEFVLYHSCAAAEIVLTDGQRFQFGKIDQERQARIIAFVNGAVFQQLHATFTAERLRKKLQTPADHVQYRNWLKKVNTILASKGQAAADAWADAHPFEISAQVARKTRKTRKVQSK